MKEALIYWGKIVQRQNKIKFIRNSRKISSIEDFVSQAVEEEEFIKNEKDKFDGENAENTTNMSLEKLKIVQVIDRENRMRNVWNEEDEDEEGDEAVFDDDRGFTADDMGDEENPLTTIPAQGGPGAKKRRGDDGTVVPDGDYYKKPKKAVRKPNAAKFKDIMKNEEAFPTLENNFTAEGEDEGEEKE